MTEAMETPRTPADAQLCGFSRCRAPLPPPGPRGGRPFEFCPARSWPGGKTCKQLAAAEDALRDALGATTDAVALAGTTSEFVARADQLLEPVTALAAALREVRERVDVELSAAAAAVDGAETGAAHDRGLREQAEQAAQTAEAARVDAVADAEAAFRHRDEARREADEAVSAAREAELGRTRQEVVAATERERAEEAENRARGDRETAERVREELAALRERMATTVAETVALRESLTEAREAVERTERRSSAAAEQARTAAAEAAERAREETGRAGADARADRERLAAARKQLDELNGSHHEELGRVREELGAARLRAEQAAEEAADSRRLLDDLRATVADAGTMELRPRLAAALGVPESPPEPRPDAD
ncbi:hypothetical protein CFN78_11715 [Amycolatopsis antarctica]|uniref:Response regulator receiver protein n=1 Tax=Amycolatopsis antarctica TaxID=1854586 RepID=A0A263D372_9PSEU|nr:hypothetical protein [Amycolatopsis antarctica]OZM72922.1 hypothetical protein CFN78_11715 [Amycolatopsis antarctica]